MLLILFKGTLCSNIWKRWCLYSIRYVFGCLIFFFQKLLLVSILKQYTRKKKCLAQPNYVDKTKKNVLNDYKKSKVQFVHERQQARPRLHEFGHFSVVDPREGSSPLILSEARRAEKKFFFDTAPPPHLSEGLDSPLLLKPQVFFTRFRVDGAFNLYGERSHKDAVSVCGFPFVRVGGKSIRETKNA